MRKLRKLVIIVNGYPRSGKDTFANQVIESLAEMDWQARNISSIDPVRDALRRLGVPVDKKGPAERELLADTKAALEKYDNYASRICINDALGFLGRDGDRAVFLHVREPEAIAFMATQVPEWVVFLTTFIDRPVDSAALSNAADRGVEAFSYDFYFKNNGTLEQLEEIADTFAEHLSQLRVP